MITTFLGRGTATGEVLDLYGLHATEKAVVTTVADAEKTKQVIRSAKMKLFIVGLSSVEPSHFGSILKKIIKSWRWNVLA
ncbi:MAG: hypothetical protein IJ965_06980 [Campylobacter sp.]|nr:hypothetical protein [Campylobacter sp.]